MEHGILKKNTMPNGVGESKGTAWLQAQSSAWSPCAYGPTAGTSCPLPWRPRHAVLTCATHAARPPDDGGLPRRDTAANRAPEVGQAGQRGHRQRAGRQHQGNQGGRKRARRPSQLALRRTRAGETHGGQCRQLLPPPANGVPLPTTSTQLMQGPSAPCCAACAWPAGRPCAARRDPCLPPADPGSRPAPGPPATPRPGRPSTARSSTWRSRRRGRGRAPMRRRRCGRGRR